MVVYNPEDYDDTTSASEIVKLKAGTIIAPTESPIIKEHTVVFNVDGRVISTQYVKDGYSAITPENPTKESDSENIYHFAGWDKAYTNVKEDMIITAIFEPESISQYILGDVNEDGIINASDALCVLKYIAKLSDLSEKQVKISDVNIDGNINPSDALMILKYVARLIEQF